MSVTGLIGDRRIVFRPKQEPEQHEISKRTPDLATGGLIRLACRVSRQSCPQS